MPVKGICKLKSLNDFEIKTPEPLPKENKFLHLKRNSDPQRPITKIIEDGILFEEKMKRIQPDLQRAKKIVVFFEEMDYKFSTHFYKDIKLTKYSNFFEPHVHLQMRANKKTSKIQVDLIEKVKIKKENGLTFTHFALNELVKKGKVSRIVTSCTSNNLEKVGIPKEKIVHWYGHTHKKSNLIKS